MKGLIIFFLFGPIFLTQCVTASSVASGKVDPLALPATQSMQPSALSGYSSTGFPYQGPSQTTGNVPAVGQMGTYGQPPYNAAYGNTFNPSTGSYQQLLHSGPSQVNSNPSTYSTMPPQPSGYAHPNSAPVPPYDYKHMQSPSSASPSFSQLGEKLGKSKNGHDKLYGSGSQDMYLQSPNGNVPNQWSTQSNLAQPPSDVRAYQSPQTLYQQQGPYYTQQAPYTQQGQYGTPQIPSSDHFQRQQLNNMQNPSAGSYGGATGGSYGQSYGGSYGGYGDPHASSYAKPPVSSYGAYGKPVSSSHTNPPGSTYDPYATANGYSSFTNPTTSAYGTQTGGYGYTPSNSGHSNTAGENYGFTPSSYGSDKVNSGHGGVGGSGATYNYNPTAVKAK